LPTDLTGTPTSLGIGTYNVDADAPSGLGFNAAIAQIDALIAARIGTPAGITTGEIPVWNGSTWVRSSTLRPAQSSLATGTPAITTFLRGDGAWQKGGLNLLWDSVDAGVTLPAASITTPSLAQSFKSLLVTYQYQQNSGASQNLYVRPNSDATAINYDGVSTHATGSTLTVNHDTVSSAWVIGNGSFGTGQFLVNNYTGGTNHMFQGTYSEELHLWTVSGFWAGVVPITTLNFFPASGSFSGWARISVYGI
jgi:hypothetical protein